MRFTNRVLYSDDYSTENAILWTPTLDGNRYLFNGSPSELPTRSNRSMFAWVKVVPESRISAKGLIGIGSDSDDRNVVAYTIENSAAVYASGFNFNVTEDPNAVLTPNEWHLVGMTWSDSQLKIVVNNYSWILDVSRQDFDATSIAVGIFPSLNSDTAFRGSIEKFGIWDRALSSDDAAELYEAGRVNYADLPGDLRITYETNIDNASVRSVSIENLQTEQVVLENLKAATPTGLISHWEMFESNGASVLHDTINGFNGNLITGVDGIDFIGISNNHTSHPRYDDDRVLQFLGTDGYVNIPSESELNAYPITVSLWVKTEDLSTSSATGLLSKYGNGTFNGYIIYLYNGHIFAWYMADAVNNTFDGVSGLDGGTSYSDNEWHHVALTVDASGAKLYIDGSLMDSHAWNGTPGATTSSADMTLGVYDSYFEGQLDDIRIYGRALNSDDITLLFTDENPDVPGSLETITTTEGDLETRSISLANLESTSGDIQVASVVIDELHVSGGGVLQFSSLIEVTGGITSFWNLTEESGTRFDSVGSNNLEMTII